MLLAVAVAIFFDPPPLILRSWVVSCAVLYSLYVGSSTTSGAPIMSFFGHWSQLASQASPAST